MTAHCGKTFPASCLKVPIDPCNICPAAVCNRPRMCLGKPVVNPDQKCHFNGILEEECHGSKCKENVRKILHCTTGEVKYLAKLYDTIPDYCDINHLPDNEFYSTLDTLRTTCHQLKDNQIDNCSLGQTSSCSSGLTIDSPTKCVTNKGKKPKKKKSWGANKTFPTTNTAKETNMSCTSTCSTNSVSSNIMPQKKTNQSLKEKFYDDIIDFNRTLRAMEEELNTPIPCMSLDEAAKSKEINSKLDQKIPSPTKKELSNSTTNLKSCCNSYKNSLPDHKKIIFHSSPKNSLYKSFSLTDIGPEEIKDKSLKDRQSSAFFKKDSPKMSNFFPAKTETHATKTPSPIEKILMDPSECTATFVGGSRKTLSKRRRKSLTPKPPSSLKLMDLSKIDLKTATCTPSPKYPAARPNLAATLRKEVARKKLQELQNTCPYQDKTPQVDWEVRKTPAWKSLNLNESQREILRIRLQTRKAELALQKKEHELSMELMRQRVKSAPLLLEGPTYWSSGVGKLTHTCHREGNHCSKSECRTRKPKRSRERNICRICLIKCDCLARRKIEILDQIYGCPEKSISRASTQMDIKCNKKSKAKPIIQFDNESGDELSSLDRAQL